MVNTDKLRGAIKAKGLNEGDFAEKLGINKSTFSAKINSGKFTIGEADKIASLLCLSKEEATNIFFSQFVA